MKTSNKRKRLTFKYLRQLWLSTSIFCADGGIFFGNNCRLGSSRSKARVNRTKPAGVFTQPLTSRFFQKVCYPLRIGTRPSLEALGRRYLDTFPLTDKAISPILSSELRERLSFHFLNLAVLLWQGLKFQQLWAVVLHAPIVHKNYMFPPTNPERLAPMF